MKKIEVGTKNFLYPTPTTLVGANVGGKPNYIMTTFRTSFIEIMVTTSFSHVFETF